MKLLKQLRDTIRNADLSYEEVKAFEDGVAKLTIEDQIVLYRLFNENPDLIYPTYINYKAKLRAKTEGKSLEDAIDREIAELDAYFARKKVNS